MMRSMFAGVSGLKAHQVRMDIIGNNIANVNTAGYKSSRATFQDMLSQTMRPATAPTDTRGGSNPQQVGLGVQLGSIDVKHTQGNTQSTGYITDLAIEGEGFFVLGQGENRQYTRAGIFGLDNGTEGNLVSLVNGERVLGYVANQDGVIDPNSSLEPLYISASETITPRATNTVFFAGNLDNRLSAGTSVDRTVQVFDSHGREQTIVVNLEKLSGDNAWRWDADWLLVSDTFPSLNNEIENNGEYLVYGDSGSGFEMRDLTGSIVAKSGDGRMWTSRRTDDTDPSQPFTGPNFEFETPLAPGFEVRAVTDKGSIFLTSSMSLKRQFSFQTNTPVSGTPAPDFSSTLFETDSFYKVYQDNEGRFQLTDSKGVSVATSSDGTSWKAIPATPSDPEVDFDFGMKLAPGSIIKTDSATVLTADVRSYSDSGLADRTIQFNQDGSFSGLLDNKVRLEPALADALDIELDFTDFTEYADAFTAKFMHQNGYTSGALESYAIDQNGVIVGSFSNGLTRNLGQVALARFANAAGLQRSGSTMFVDTPNSGTAQIGAAGVPGFGLISPSSLEMSNVDLSEEFTEMIITQRGFQANSRIITTSDEMLQELVNLKR